MTGGESTRGADTRARGWRRVAAATWTHPSDPQIYGELEIDAGALEAYLAEARAATGVRITVTHLVGRAIALALAAQPELNTRLVRGSFRPRASVDIFFIVSTDDGRDLSGVKIAEADRKSLVVIAGELQRRVQGVRSGADASFGKGKSLLDSIPSPLLRPLLRAAAWLTTDRGVDLKRLGMPREAFGSAMVSSVGTFGVHKAFGPLSPLYRVPILALVGEITPRAVVVDGHVVPRPMLTVSATMDHRYLDGSHAARLGRSVRAYLEDPASFEPQADLAEAAL